MTLDLVSCSHSSNTREPSLGSGRKSPQVHRPWPPLAPAGPEGTPAGSGWEGGVLARHCHGPREGPVPEPSELMLSYLVEELSSPIFLIELWAGGCSVEALT